MKEISFQNIVILDDALKMLFHSSVLDPDRIQIQLGQWARIRIWIQADQNGPKKAWIRIMYEFPAMLGIRIRNRIRIRMFLGLPDPDLLVRGTDPELSLFLINVLSRQN